MPPRPRSRQPLVLLLLVLTAATACRRPEGGPAATTTPKPAAGERETVLLSGPWRFEASNDLEGAEATAFDDRAWKPVSVPHTWGERPWRRAWDRLPFAG